MPTEAAKCLQTSTITKFPDELINHILAALGTCNWEDTHQGLPEQNNWLPCALVCRRWYRITLPHLFRFVCISPKSPGDPYDFYQFLVGKPLARLVVRIVFRDLRPVMHMWLVASILKLLPNAEYVDFLSVTLQRNLNYTPLKGQSKITRLTYSNIEINTDSDRSRIDCWENLEGLLDLFSEVAILVLQETRPCPDIDKSSDECDSDTEDLARGGLNIEVLSVTPPMPDDIPHLTRLRNIGLFHNLVALEIVTILQDEIQHVTALLPYVAATLRSFRLEFSFNTEGPFPSSKSARESSLERCCLTVADLFLHRVQDLVQAMKRGITTCARLRQFWVEMTSTIPPPPEDHLTQSTSQTTYYTEYIARDWSFLLEVLSAGSHVKRLVFRYTFRVKVWRGVQVEWSRLPWSTMREQRDNRTAKSNTATFSCAAYWAAYDYRNRSKEELEFCMRNTQAWRDCAEKEGLYMLNVYNSMSSPVIPPSTTAFIELYLSQ